MVEATRSGWSPSACSATRATTAARMSSRSGGLADHRAAGQRQLPAGPAGLVDLPGRAVVLQLHDQHAGGGGPADQLLDPRGQRRCADNGVRPGQQPALHVDDDQRLHRCGHRPATRIATRTSSSNGPGPIASRRPASNAGSVGTEAGERAERTLPTMPATVWVSR